MDRYGSRLRSKTSPGLGLMHSEEAIEIGPTRFVSSSAVLIAEVHGIPPVRPPHGGSFGVHGHATDRVLGSCHPNASVNVIALDLLEVIVYRDEPRFGCRRSARPTYRTEVRSGRGFEGRPGAPLRPRIASHIPSMSRRDWKARARAPASYRVTPRRSIHDSRSRDWWDPVKVNVKASLHALGILLSRSLG